MQLRSEFEKYQHHAALGTGVAGASLDFAGQVQRPTFETLGGQRPAHATPAAAAAAAAEQRAQGAATGAASASQGPYAKGQTVEYRQRDGSWVEAKVIVGLWGHVIDCAKATSSID